jgi:FkbM family methyltransferase
MMLSSPHPIRHLEQVRRVTYSGDFLSLPCYEIDIDGKLIRYAEAGNLVRARVSTLFVKEPSTIPWLEAMQPDEVLVDIGANVGLYSIYAAVCSGCRVYAFEPEALNYAELNKNIFVNDLHGRVSAFCLAMSDETKIEFLRLGAFGVGYSHHDFGENTWTQDMVFGAGTTAKDARLEQGSVSTSLDALIEAGVIPVPDHIKIDVDGLESRVIGGCRQTLANPQVKTVLLEVEHRIEASYQLIQALTAMGWQYSMAQLRTNRKAILPVEEVERLQGERRGGFNYIFFRDPSWDQLFQHFLESYEPPLDREGRVIKGDPSVISTWTPAPDSTSVRQAARELMTAIRRSAKRRLRKP